MALLCERGRTLPMRHGYIHTHLPTGPAGAALGVLETLETRVGGSSTPRPPPAKPSPKAEAPAPSRTMSLQALLDTPPRPCVAGDRVIDIEL